MQSAAISGLPNVYNTILFAGCLIQIKQLVEQLTLSCILNLSLQAIFLSIVHTVTGPIRVRCHPVPAAFDLSSASASVWNSRR